MEIEFTKMHGLGNDYLFIDATRRPLPEEDLPVFYFILSLLFF